MLVLSRKQNERIRIGDDIVVTVVRLQGNRVQIGVEAPLECAILRGELDRFDEALDEEVLDIDATADDRSGEASGCEVSEDRYFDRVA